MFHSRQQRSVLIATAIGVAILIAYASISFLWNSRNPSLGSDEWVQQIDFDRLYRDMLAAPPKRWTTNLTEVGDQVSDFNNWIVGNWRRFPVTMLDTAEVVREALRSPEKERSQLFTSRRGDGGFVYSIRVTKYDNGADCEIKFVGTDKQGGNK